MEENRQIRWSCLTAISGQMSSPRPRVQVVRVQGEVGHESRCLNSVLPGFSFGDGTGLCQFRQKEGAGRHPLGIGRYRMEQGSVFHLRFVNVEIGIDVLNIVVIFEKVH